MGHRSPDGSDTQPSIISECSAVVQSLLNSSDIGIALVGPASTVEWVNAPLETYFGLEAGTVTGESYEAFVETHLAPCLANPAAVPVVPEPEDGSDRRELHVLPQDDRPERLLKYRAHPITSGPASGGHLLQFTDITAEGPTAYERTSTGTTQDSTEQAAKRRRTQEFMRDIQSVAEVGGWEVDLRSDTLRWTDEVYHIHELPTTYEPTVSDSLGFYHPDDRAAVTSAFEKLTIEGEPYDLELRIVTATDEVRWVRALGRPWRDDDGEQVGARGTFQDITERKSREQELRRKSRALDAAPVGITITDPSQDDNPMIYQRAVRDGDRLRPRRCPRAKLPVSAG